MMTGSGGWPLTIIMTPDKKPFFSGTYFPKEARFGRLGLKDLIKKEVLSHLVEFRYGLYFILTSVLVITSFFISMQTYQKKYDEHQFLAGTLKPEPTNHCNYPVIDYPAEEYRF